MPSIYLRVDCERKRPKVIGVSAKRQVRFRPCRQFELLRHALFSTPSSISARNAELQTGLTGVWSIRPDIDGEGSDTPHTIYCGSASRGIFQKIAPLEEKLVMRAAYLKAEYPISYADAFAAAVTGQEKATLITGDPDLKRIEKIIKIKWLK